jgi:hypothetical protein
VWGSLLLIVGCVLTALALVMLRAEAANRRRSRRAAWGAGEVVASRPDEELESPYAAAGGVALIGLTSLGFGLLLLTRSLAVAGPLLAAVWAGGLGFFAYCFADRRHLRWASYLSGSVGGLILVVSLPAWLDWGRLYFRGVPVRARIVSMQEGSTYDPDDDGYRRFPVTHVTYQFEAEVGGQRHQFRREGELPGGGRSSRRCRRCARRSCSC